MKRLKNAADTTAAYAKKDGAIKEKKYFAGRFAFLWIALHYSQNDEACTRCGCSHFMVY